METENILRRVSRQTIRGGLKRSELEYHLPAERIAQSPATPRDAARLWVERISTGESKQTRVRQLADHLAPGDLLVFNNTKVLPARVYARRTSGARIEVLFLEPERDSWLAMVRPAKKTNPGESLIAADGSTIEMLERVLEPDGNPGPLWRVRHVGLDSGSRSEPGASPERQTDPTQGFSNHPALQDPEWRATQAIMPWLDQVGEMPLPPYIHRESGGLDADRERYQTIFAKHPGAVAAPTAGLHFTDGVLDSLQDLGVATAQVTLHVGMGTFLPMQVESVEEHRMHEERYGVGSETVEAVARCKASGGRVIAVGTTSARALEASASGGALAAGLGRTDLFITPGYPFRVVDGLFTNFHLPGSTLLLLVGALVGCDRLLDVYQQAIDADWRFYSYGDAMLILP